MQCTSAPFLVLYFGAFKESVVLPLLNSASPKMSGALYEQLDALRPCGGTCLNEGLQAGIVSRQTLEDILTQHVHPMKTAIT